MVQFSLENKGRKVKKITEQGTHHIYNYVYFHAE